MVIKGDEHHRFGDKTQSERGEVMKIARAVQKKLRRKVRLVFPIELFDQAWWRGKTQTRSPTSRVHYRKAARFVRPRLVEIEMKSAIDQRSPMRGWEKFGIGRLGKAQVFLGFLVVRIAPQRFVELDHGLGDLALSQVHSA